MVWSGTNKEIKKDYLFPFKMVMQEKSRVLNHGYYLIYLFTLIYTQLVLEMYFYKSDFCLTVDLLSYLTMWLHAWNRLILPLHASSVNLEYTPISFIIRKYKRIYPVLNIIFLYLKYVSRVEKNHITGHLHIYRVLSTCVPTRSSAFMITHWHALSGRNQSIWATSIKL